MLLGRFLVAGHSMQPTIRFGQEVLISSFPYVFRKPMIGDIIIFRKHKKVYIKRITAVASENSYIVGGDNKQDSLDSKTFGEVKKKEILGKLIYTFS